MPIVLLVSICLSVCAEETSSLWWLNFEELFLNCLQAVVVWWMLLALYHFLLSSSNIHEIKYCVIGQINKIFCDMLVFVFIIHLGNFLHMVVDITV
jgi:hypothetical protein